MFSGISETTGIIRDLKTEADCLRLSILPQEQWSDVNIGDSISVNGVCLTVTGFHDGAFSVAVVPETMRLTNLGSLMEGSLVNLERSLKVGDRIGGHYVQGHVDDVGEIIELHPDGKGAQIFKISMPPRLEKYIVNKGYITLDGMSITIIEITKEWFAVTLIPHTHAVSIAANYRIGSKINIEVDILGKYVEKWIRG